MIVMESNAGLGASTAQPTPLALLAAWGRRCSARRLILSGACRVTTPPASTSASLPAAERRDTRDCTF